MQTFVCKQLFYPQKAREVLKPLRSQKTRDRILDEARRLFAEQGFERTTIRGIASAARINPSMVIRYYGTKEELFATAIALEFHMPDFSRVPVRARGEALVAHILDQWDAGDELPTLLRSAGTNETARARLVQAVQAQASPAIAAILTGDRQQERLALIVMQIAGLVLSRYVLKHPVVMGLDRDALVRAVGGAIQHSMNRTR